PRWLARHHKDAPKGWPGPIWEAQAQQITIYHGREPDARFLAEAASRDSGRSFTASTVLIDEWAYQQWAREIWQAAYPTINRPTGGQVIGLSTAKPATQFHEIWVGAEHEWRRPDAPANGFYGVFLPWTADPRRTPEWYEATKAALPATYRAEYPATPDEAFSCGQDLAFPEFDFNVHTCEPFEIPVGWSRYRGLDWGFAAPFAALWAAVDYDGTLIVYREWYQNRLHVPEVAAGILDRSKEETFAGSVADPSIWARAGHSGPSIGEDFGKHGLWWCKADNDRLQGWAAVHQRLRVDPETGKPAIRIFRTCKNLIRELGHAMQDPHRAEDVETNQSDHALDSLRYICLARPYAPSKPKEPEPWWLKKAERKPFNWRAQL
ncbi:MAG: hypothetical protein FJZ01_20580, partial [Candidatus Sericytochromatia bacterium]|nr:hypothetical protein [Candidatus Tanganyikabacteria bacterium]